MLYTALGGIKGETFCSALQLSHRFKMLSWSYNGGFFGNYLCVGKMVASIAQGTSPCAQSARRQRPCCRPLPRWVSLPKWICLLHRSLWSHVLVLPPLSGRGFFQLQKQTCQKLWPLSALEFEARLLLPSSSSKIKMSRTVRLRRTTWFPSANQFTESSVQTAFKSCGCFATALVWKAVFTPNWFCLMSPLSRRRDDF